MVPDDPQPASPASGSPGAAPLPPPPGFGRRHWGKLTLLALVGVPVVGLALWSAIALSYTYSSGTRTGYVQKLSKKGWLCKTWEGELAMATAPGVSPEIFAFTIRSDSLAEALTEEMGRGRARIAVQYDEHRGVPTSCFGDTPYFVKGFTTAESANPLPLP